MPTELFEYRNGSFSVSGKNNCGQGGDFVHEELNKRIKSLLPPIMPTPEVWTRVCRKMKDLEEQYNNITRLKETIQKIQLRSLTTPS